MKFSYIDKLHITIRNLLKKIDYLFKHLYVNFTIDYVNRIAFSYIVYYCLYDGKMPPNYIHNNYIIPDSLLKIGPNVLKYLNE